MKTSDLTGQRFGTLTAMRHKSQRAKNGRAISMWLCRCDCGIEKCIAKINLTQGRVKTCASGACPFRMALRMQIMGHRNYVSGKQHIFTTYKRKALSSGKPFLIDREAFWELIASNCYYCGATPSNRSRRGPNKKEPYFYNGVDRIDSRRGYVPDNVRPCCWICNRMKHVLSEAEFFRHITAILDYNASRLVA